MSPASLLSRIGTLSLCQLFYPSHPCLLLLLSAHSDRSTIACTCAYTHMHTCTHAHTHTRMHVVCTCTHTGTHTLMHTYTPAPAHDHMHATCTCTHTETCTHTHHHMHMITCMPPVHAHIQKHTHLHMQSYTHVDSHADPHTRGVPFLPSAENKHDDFCGVNKGNQCSKWRKLDRDRTKSESHQ